MAMSGPLSPGVAGTLTTSPRMEGSLTTSPRMEGSLTPGSRHRVVFNDLSQAQALLAIKDVGEESEIERRIADLKTQSPALSHRSTSYTTSSEGGSCSSRGPFVALRPTPRTDLTSDIPSPIAESPVPPSGRPPPKPSRRQPPSKMAGPAGSTPTPEQKRKRSRRASASGGTSNNVHVQGSKEGSVTGGENKKKNRISVLYNSMRAATRRGSKNSENGEQQCSTAEAEGRLRLMEEQLCEDPKKLLADRMRELRKVESVKVQNDDREEFPIFEFVCEVSIRGKGEQICPYISWSHPPLRVLEDDNNSDSVKSLPMFCFPDIDLVEPLKKMKTETYCFVFTDLQAQNKFGYCRRFLPAAKDSCRRYPVVYCMVTKIRSFETFSKIFDKVVELRNYNSAGAYAFLKALIGEKAPKPGLTLTIQYINPQVGSLVSHAMERATAEQRFEHVDLVDVLGRLGAKLLLEIFINLLVERKVLFVAENLSDLTTVIHAIMQLLHPLQWQGIYIPVLPQEILDATSSPVPFVIGILKQHARELDEEALDDECSTVYISEKKMVKRPNFTDIPFNKKTRKRFQLTLKTYKKRMSKVEKCQQQTIDIGDMFFEMMREMMGHYADHVTYSEGEAYIDQHSFSEGSGQNSDFVWHIAKTQMFSSFVQSLSERESNPFLAR